MTTTKQRWVCIGIFILMNAINTEYVQGNPFRILLDTDVDTDDLFALLYILKLNTSEFDLQAVTINTNAWTNAGHAVNQVYDLLYMMGRDDIAVGVGGEGEILQDGTILPNVGGYHPIIEQGNGTAGYCRYRQAIPVGLGGRLDIDTNFGFRKSFLPQGKRRYSPLHQPTAQQVMIDKISAGPITVFTIGANTNLGVFLMTNPHLKKNIEHIYMMGGAVRSTTGNVFTDYTCNPYAEFNMFGDPFAAYQVIHSGIPVTLVPLDATNTIPISPNFFDEFEKNQHTYEAQYCFMSLKMARDTRSDEYFFTSYFMWDSFMSGVATSIMLKQNKFVKGENEFAEMEYMNITVVTSNEPNGIISNRSSNPLFDGLKKPKFGLKRNSVHSGHVQTGIHDPFCIVKNRRGRCKDGYTEEVSGPESVGVLVAVRAKPNHDRKSLLDREYFTSFLDILNRPQQTGKFNFTTEYPHYRKVLYEPDLKGRKLGKNVVFDMDMSAGDFLALFYLLKLPVEIINLKGILVSPTGWANAATIDIVYDLLHMMGRDDIPVGLGDVFAMNQSDPIFPSVGDCKYSRAIPHGSGGFIDSDTLYGLARDLPRSPRRYTTENSVKFGAPRNTDHPELRQSLAIEIWQSVIESLDSGSKITILTNGPLTNIASIVSNKNFSSPIEEILIVGGHIIIYNNHSSQKDKGNVINISSNEYAELNMFLDPIAANTVFNSRHNITLIPLDIQRKVCEFHKIIETLRLRLTKNKTPESLFSERLLSRLHQLKRTHPRYQHMDIFLGEILGAVVLGGGNNNSSVLNMSFGTRKLQVMATGAESEDGRIIVTNKNNRNSVKVLENVDSIAYYDAFVNQLVDENQSAVIGSFNEQTKIWRRKTTQN